MDKVNLNLKTRNDFDDIVIDKIPIIDVRAPIEYQRGSFPTSVNLPIMSDEDRKLIGTCYKLKGREDAMKMGFQLVAGDIKAKRLQSWLEALKDKPNSIIMCFRGGLRSKIAQSWIHDTREHTPFRLEGGYKAFRNHLMDSLLPENIPMIPILLGGNTGVGKTILLKKLTNAIDLESLANHRGSAFGDHLSPQPSQIDFENNLAYEVITQKNMGHDFTIYELEGKNIGKLMIPQAFRNYLESAKLVSIITSLESRVEITWQEFVVEAIKEYKVTYAENAISMWQVQMDQNLLKIKQRLGGDRFSYVKTLFDSACNSQNIMDHKQWIEYLLVNYYDPMYEFNKSKWTNKILFEGSPDEVYDFLRSMVATTT